MLKDNIKNAYKYYSLSDRFEIGLKYLQSTDFSSVENGTYKLLGDEVFANVQDYNTKSLDNAKFEAHRKYADIQFIVSGSERIGVDKVNNFAKSTEYSSSDDIEFLSENSSQSKCSFCTVKSDDFVILMPDDAHMPSVSPSDSLSSHVKKVVVKVLV